MLKLTPILLAIAYALVMYKFSVWRTKSELDQKSSELADPALKRITDRMAAALDLAVRRTRRFARRQERWFRRDPRIVWLDATRPASELVDEVVDLARG